MDYLITFDDGTEALAHYGVLGMRWGVRHNRAYKSAKKAAIKQYKADKKQDGLKRKDKKQLKADLKNKINDEKVNAANKLYSHNSVEANRRIQTRSTAKTLGATAIFGSYGAMHRDRAYAEHGKAGKAAVRGLLAGELNRLAAPVPGIHNYVKDRRARKTGQVSGSTNRHYI